MGAWSSGWEGQVLREYGTNTWRWDGETDNWTKPFLESANLYWEITMT